MKRILDIGCGPAPTVLEAIEDNGWSVEYVGIDGNRKIIETARYRHPGAVFIESLVPYNFRPKELGNFDIVTAFTSLEYLNRPEKAATICGINQVLKKNGDIISTFPRKSEKDAREVEQFLKSLEYNVKRDYVALDFEGIEGSRYFWTVAGNKAKDIDTEADFSRYNAMAYLKAGKPKEAKTLSSDLGSLADELRRLESIDVMSASEKMPECNRLKELEKEETEAKDLRRSITPQMRRNWKYYNMYKTVDEKINEIQKEKSELLKRFTKNISLSIRN